MSSDTIIKVENISKRYRIGVRQKKSDTLVGRLKDIVQSPFRNYQQLRKLSRFSTEDESVFWALKEVSFEVKRGEVLGIIGKNGAGKSTLLKILSQITEPTSGRIELNGRVAALLEVGTGFHPELTGRDNIYMNGTILGMTRKEINQKLDEIIDFSGVEKFIDTPVKFYSSGMKVRLGFSVAAHLEPEILVVDEVLAVGDWEFQEKCLGKMESISKSQGRTVLFVSHNMSAVQKMCHAGLVLKQGQVVFQGDVSEAIRQYVDVSVLNCEITEWVNPNSHADSDSIVKIEKASLQLIGKQPFLKLKVDTHVVSHQFHKSLFIAYDISSLEGVPIFQSIPSEKPFIQYSNYKKIISAEVVLPKLIPGFYRVSVWIGEHYNLGYLWEKDILSFEIIDSPSIGRTYPHSSNNGYLVQEGNINIYEEEI